MSLLIAGANLKIEDFQYDSHIGNMIYDNILQTDFMGFKGNIYFDETGGSITNTQTHQWLPSKSYILHSQKAGYHYINLLLTFSTDLVTSNMISDFRFYIIHFHAVFH